MKSWKCIENCGACCKFDLESRDNIFEALNNKDISLIISMTGKDGWCKNFDKKNKKCLIYEKRPHFCRVDDFSKKFNGYKKNGDDFLIDCCKQHISSIYGSRSETMKIFKYETKLINK